MRSKVVDQFLEMSRIISNHSERHIAFMTEKSTFLPCCMAMVNVVVPFPHRGSVANSASSALSREDVFKILRGDSVEVLQVVESVLSGLLNGRLTFTWRRADRIDQTSPNLMALFTNRPSPSGPVRPDIERLHRENRGAPPTELLRYRNVVLPTTNNGITHDAIISNLNDGGGEV